MDIRIRPAVLKDAANFRRCYAMISKEGQYVFSAKIPSLAFTRADLRASMRKKDTVLVAIDRKQIIGWVAVLHPATPSLSHCGDLRLFLPLAYQGKGLEIELVTKALKIARSEFEAVIFSSFRRNKPAQEMATKLGFKLCGYQKNFAKLAYGFDDNLIMQKQL